MRTSRSVAMAMLLCVSSGNSAGADESLPWVFNAPEAKGYSIKLDAVDPAPGTPLVRGSKVTITVTVTYAMSIAAHGVIILVPQDEGTRPASPGTPQVKQEVSASNGSTTLKQQLVVPKDAKELRVFVPLVPDGLTNTTGEITIRYPIVRKK